MRKTFKWVLGGLGAAVLLLGAALGAARVWVGSDDFRQRLASEASAALGVPVVLGGVTVAVWPLPALALDKVTVQTQPPLRADRLELRPAMGALLRGQLDLTALVLRRAELPQRGVDALLDALQKKEQYTQQARGVEAKSPPKAGQTTAALPQRLQLDDVTWVDLQGRGTTVDARAQLADDGLPQTANLTVRRGRLQGARLTLRRADPAAGVVNPTPTWTVDAALGGGTVRGEVQVASTPQGKAPGWRVQGMLETRNVEVSALIAPASGATPPLSGKLEASTRLQTQGDGMTALVDALQSQTRFTVAGAVVHGIDLVRAVKTVGISRGGETRLDSLNGQVTSSGRSVRLHDLVAGSGALSARGEVTLSPARTLGGRLMVDVVTRKAGLLTVPLEVGGTLDAPSVSLSRSAALGAAIGTVILPGVGTGAGANLGDRLGDKLKGWLGR